MFDTSIIQKPIFIIGSGRSGTTVLYNLLSSHPEAYWFSDFTNKNPYFSYYNLIHGILRMPFVKKVFHNDSFMTPSEGDLIYRRCGFIDSKKSTDSDVSLETRNKFKHIIQIHKQLTGKHRFINKQTANTQRLEPLNAMFSDAYWIHIVRDGRAVVNSLLKTEWWLDTPIWWLGRTPRQWSESGRSQEALCAQHWKHNVMEITSSKSIFSDRYLQIYYEDLAKNPRNVINTIMRFCKLAQDENYLDTIPSVLINMNVKWRNELTKKQIEVIENESGILLRTLGYM